MSYSALHPQTPYTLLTLLSLCATAQALGAAAQPWLFTCFSTHSLGAHTLPEGSVLADRQRVIGSRPSLPSSGSTLRRLSVQSPGPLGASFPLCLWEAALWLMNVFLPLVQCEVSERAGASSILSTPRCLRGLDMWHVLSEGIGTSQTISLYL